MSVNSFMTQVLEYYYNLITFSTFSRQKWTDALKCYTSFPRFFQSYQILTVTHALANINCCSTFSQIEVTETGTAEKYSDNATVYVQLINANDNTPKFLHSSYNYTFDEEIFPGNSIAVITVSELVVERYEYHF